MWLENESLIASSVSLLKDMESTYDSTVNGASVRLGGVGLLLMSDVNTDPRVFRLRVTCAAIFRSGIAERPNMSVMVTRPLNTIRALALV